MARVTQSIRELPFQNLKGIHHVFYDDISRRNIWQSATPYDNTGKLTEYFESGILLELLQQDRHLEHNFFGVLSWKFSAKTNCSQVNLDQILEDCPADVVSFYRRNGHVVNGYFEKLDIFHTGITNPTLFEAMGMLLDRMGVSYDLRAPIRANTFTQCNYVVAKASYWEKYKPFLQKAYDAVEGDPDFKAILMRRCPYHRDKQGNLQKALQAQIGQPYYPAIPFLFERLHTVFLNINYGKYNIFQV